MTPAEEIRALPSFARARVFSLVTAEMAALLETRPPRELARGAFALWERLAEPTGDPAYAHKRRIMRDLLGLE